MSRNVSTAARRALYASQTGEAFLILLEITHPDLAVPIRITSDMVDTQHGNNTTATFTRPDSTIHPDTGATVAANIPCYFAEGGLYVRDTESLSFPVTLGAAATVEVSVRYIGESFLMDGEELVMTDGTLYVRSR